MKLITEHNDDLRYLTEEKNGEKKYMIEGIFAQADAQNRNGRVYPKKTLESATKKYQTEQVSRGRAVGELGHPDSPTINLDRVSHKIVELNWDGNNVMGKAEILETPMGKIVRGLMDGEVQLGVSTRGMGSLKQEKGKTIVSDDFILSTVDIVQDPSAPDAFVNGIMEGYDFYYNEDEIIAVKSEEYYNKMKKMNSKQLAEQQMKLFKDYLNDICGNH
jgi:hypothetical protein